MARARVYTQEQYDEATRRLSKKIDITNIKNIRELDRLLKSEEVYHDIKGGSATIYDQLVDNWKKHVEPSELIKQEQAILKRKKQPRLSQYAIRKKRRDMNRLNGVSYYREENKIKIKQVRGETRQYILHQGRYRRLDDIIVYNRTIIKRDKVIQKWYTRRKPKSKKQS